MRISCEGQQRVSNWPASAIKSPNSGRQENSTETRNSIRKNGDKFFPTAETLIYDNEIFSSWKISPKMKKSLHTGQELCDEPTESHSGARGVSRDLEEKWYPCSARTSTENMVFKSAQQLANSGKNTSNGEDESFFVDLMPDNVEPSQIMPPQSIPQTPSYMIRGKPYRISLSLYTLSVVLSSILCILGGYIWWQKNHHATMFSHLPPQNFPQIEFSTTSTPPTLPSSASIPTPIKHVISIVGAIAHPGVYKLDEQARINDVLISAGPVLPQGTLLGLNRAELIEDGEQIVISLKPGESYIEYASGSAHHININTASVATLAAVPGISFDVAYAIVAYRRGHGKFHALEDLLQVPGIKTARLAKIRPYLLCLS